MTFTPKTLLLHLATKIVTATWYHFTRALGSAIVIDQWLIHTHGGAMREVLILIGAGMIGYDKVARSDDVEA